MLPISPVLEIIKDQSDFHFFASRWLHQATATLQGHWAMKNARRSGNAEFSPLPEKARVSSHHSTATRATVK